MHARSRALRLSRPPLNSPLLIPSVSSKGFGRLSDGTAEPADVLELAHTDMPEALLISAYDLEHDLLRDVERLTGPQHRETVYGTPLLLVVDSGGYELADDFESGETRRDPRTPQAFTREQFEGMADRMPKDRDILVVSYDRPDTDRPGYDEQRAAAQDFFGRRPHFKSDFLLKPPAGDRFVEPDKIVATAADLRAFDVIGVTEKDIGDTLLDRLERLARLRQVLDGHGCGDRPIHVFGSLDPVLTPLYFMAGAEIFDGLSWLRYAYHHETAVHPETLAVLTGSLDSSGPRRDQTRHLSNLAELGRLKNRLESWTADPERFEVLGRHHEQLRSVYDLLNARLKRGR